VLTLTTPDVDVLGATLGPDDFAALFVGGFV
jgi:hypothetical protein